MREKSANEKKGRQEKTGKHLENNEFTFEINTVLATRLPLFQLFSLIINDTIFYLTP